MKVKQGESVDWLFLKIIAISMESSRRDLVIEMIVDRFIFKNNKIALPPVSPSYIKQMWDYLKQGLAFTVSAG